MRVRAEQKQRSAQKQGEVSESGGDAAEKREREEAKQKQGVGKYGGERRREPVAMAVIRLPT